MRIRGRSSADETGGKGPYQGDDDASSIWLDEDSLAFGHHGLGSLLQ